MDLVWQALPWEPTYNREIKDANNAVVQYTQANIGVMCSAVNAHARLVKALDDVQLWLREPASSRSPEGVLLAAVESAIGRIGAEQLAANVEVAMAPSPELDRAISVELRIAEAQYTSSIDLAMSLIPAGGKWAVDMKQPNYVESPAHASQSVTVYVITVTTALKTASGTHPHMPMAICIAALRARG